MTSPEHTNGRRNGFQKGASGCPERMWKKGQSGNPGGMSRKLVDIIRLAREASAETFALLLELRRSPDPAVALRACCYVLDRAWGHPPAAVPIETALRHEALEGRSDLEQRAYLIAQYHALERRRAESHGSPAALRSDVETLEAVLDALSSVGAGRAESAVHE